MNTPSSSGSALGGFGTQPPPVSSTVSAFGFSGITAQSTPIQVPPVSTQAPTFGSNTQVPTFGSFAAASSTAAPVTTTTSGFSFLSPSTPVSAPIVNPVSSAPATTTTPATGLTFGTGLTGLAATKTTKSVTFSLTSSATTTTAPLTPKSILKTTSSVSTPTTAVSSTASSATSSTDDQVVNYIQLQDLTNKWISEFEDMQKLLLNQTSEIINRDVILASNEDRIEKLVNSVQNLKSEQTVVEQQLDFILSQQKDLEECLVSLEDEVSSYFPDLPADDVYKLAENIDSRLKKTLETSKEIITKINDKNRLSENVANPMVAIGRILNHHTNSIQMLEDMNAEGEAKLSDLQKNFQQYTRTT